MTNKDIVVTSTVSALPLQISCLYRVEALAKAWPATHVISLLDPDISEQAIPKLTAHVEAHHVIRIFDQERAEATHHFDAVISGVLNTLQAILEGPANRLIIHCHAGVSRSTAIGHGALALIHGAGREDDAFNELLRITRKPWPNRRIVEVIDNALNRGGTMLAPLDAYREANPYRLDSYRRLNRKRGIVSKVQR